MSINHFSRRWLETIHRLFPVLCMIIEHPLVGTGQSGELDRLGPVDPGLLVAGAGQRVAAAALHRLRRDLLAPLVLASASCRHRGGLLLHVLQPLVLLLKVGVAVDIVIETTSHRYIFISRNHVHVHRLALYFILYFTY